METNEQKLEKNKKYGATIRDFRDTYRLSQTDMSVLCGVSYLTYTSVERGSNCSHKTLDKINETIKNYKGKE